MKTLWGLAALLTALTLTGCHSWGHPWGWWGHPSIQNLGDKMESEIHKTLSLTAAQDQKLKVVIATVQKAVRSHLTAVADDSAGWDALIEAPQFDQAAFRAKLDQRDAQAKLDRAALLDELTPQLADFLDSLTPDQKTKIVNWHHKFLERIKSLS